MNGYDVDTDPGTRWGGCAWLLLVIPTGAARFSTDDDRVGATLVAAGGSLDDASPDLEVLADTTHIRARAPRAVTCVSARPADRGPWVARRVTRVVRGLGVRLRAGRAALRLRRHGYRSCARMPWEPEGAYAPSLVEWRRGRTLGDLLPENLVVAADRTRPPTTILERALELSALQVGGGPFEIERLLVRDMSLVVFAPRAVLRVELGGQRSGVARQVDALTRLGELPLSREAAGRTPGVLGHGSVGLGAWSLEERLPGATRPEGLDRVLVDQCVEFLLALADAWRGPVDPDLLAIDEDVVLRACNGAMADDLRSLTRWISAAVAALPGGLAHGDFFARNILVDSGRLTGVVDWERSTTGRPLFHDLVHFRIAEKSAAEGTAYGRAAVTWAESAAKWRSDARLVQYSGRVSLEPGAATMAAVAAGCWLAQVAHQLSRAAENGADRAWVTTNVTGPALELQRVAARLSG